ncbi:hypothetical protein C6P40_005407 [Pichia californica]|uniref:Kinetochore protein SPC25 n=1 Tax=Pichia californica TaxID=460514 RepID=A0A9P7BGH4_9ASCO|nr:hypothetical protein C6P42_001031 [[Candida] californica]KAG0689210.1 hypothetical protein C6P40_005407 [[Candida] californica]
MQNNMETQVRVNLENLQALKPQIQELKQVVGSYIHSVQDSIIKRRTEYQTKLSQLRSTETQLKLEIEMNKKLREQLLEELSSEMRNRDQSSVKYEEMKIQQEDLEKQRGEFNKQLEEIETLIATKIRQINEERDIMKNQTILVNDKLYQFEQLLGLRIEQSFADDDEIDNDETSEGDMITFIFRNIDPKDFSKEASFVFDPMNVKIISSEPPLPEETFTEAIDIFVKTKEIAYLWKYMRSSFQSLLVSSQ